MFPRIALLLLATLPAASGHKTNLRSLGDNSCNRGTPGIEGECTTTGQCQSMYSDAFDCKKGDFGDASVGECYCRIDNEEKLCGCDAPPTPPTPTPPTSICESGKKPDESLPYSFAIQELLSPPGPRHSNGFLQFLAGDEPGDQIDLIWFLNEITMPREGYPQGSDSIGIDSGHCVQVEYAPNGKLACYITFNVQSSDKTGSITAEALFDLTNFPAADLVLTAGTGDFKGIVGEACTSKVPGVVFDGTTFIYNLFFDLH